MITFNEIVDFIKESKIWTVKESSTALFGTDTNAHAHISIRLLDWNLKPYEKEYFKACDYDINSSDLMISLPVPCVSLYKDFLGNEKVTLDIDLQTYIQNKSELYAWHDMCEKVYEEYKLEIRKLHSKKKIIELEKDFE